MKIDPEITGSISPIYGCNYKNKRFN